MAGCGCKKNKVVTETPQTNNGTISLTKTQDTLVNEIVNKLNQINNKS